MEQSAYLISVVHAESTDIFNVRLGSYVKKRFNTDLRKHFFTDRIISK